MRYDFIKEPIKLKDIPKDCPYEPVVLENNEKQINEICNFLQSDSKLMLISGFKGTGKSLICDFISSNLESQVLQIKYRCFETTILDDMLLGFFEIFRKYAKAGKIMPPKTKVDNFTQKINSYFDHIASPVLITISSFETVLKANKIGISNFIKHLSEYPNVKIIIIAQKFLPEEFYNVDFNTTTLLALSKENFEKYLKSNDIKQIGVLSNELYKQTKGYYENIKLSVKIMKLRGYNITEFLECFSKSLIAFPDFLIREVISLIDPISTHLFRLLAMMRIPVHKNILKTLNLYNEERIKFFTDNSILKTSGESLFLDEALREVIERQIPDNVTQKLHRTCIDLYKTQIPTKPLERDIKLSRQTMRSEVEYHSLFLPKKFTPQPNTTTETRKIEAAEISEEIKVKEPEEQKPKTSEENESLLNDIASSIENFINEKDKTIELKQITPGLGVVKLINLAREEEAKFNYKNAIMLYQNALTKKNDEDFLTFLPTIYVSLAQNYKNISRWYETLEYYTQAQDFYYNAGNKLKVAEIKLGIANIYYLVYKNKNAEFILKELKKDRTLPNELQIKINLALGKLNNQVNAYVLYKQALNLVDYSVSKPVISELYYNFAVASDETGETKTAAIYYKKCMDLDSNPEKNPYLSASLSNLAEIYDNAGAQHVAEKYYEESIKIDTDTKNYNGLYISARNLAEIYSSKDEQKSIEWLEKAYQYAKELKEPYYIADSCLEIGNYYFVRKNYELAYKYFKEAREIDKSSFNKSNAESINSKMENIKKYMIEEEFLDLREKYNG